MEFIVILWVGISIACGAAASARGRSGFGWFALALLISPLIALLLLIAFPIREKVVVAPGEAPGEKLSPGRQMAVGAFWIVVGAILIIGIFSGLSSL